jgi:hypothetical protein
MIIRQNDLVILKGETTPRRVLAVEHHYTGDYYIFDGLSTQRTISIVDIDKTIKYQIDLKADYILDGCHSL